MSDTKTIDLPRAPEVFIKLLHERYGTHLLSASPQNAPEHPDIGDVWIEPSSDAFVFYIWDGDKWIEALSGGDKWIEALSGGDESSREEQEQDTPEKAYERAMRVLK